MLRMMFGLVILALLAAIYVLSPAAAWVALGVLTAYALVSRRPHRRSEDVAEVT